MNGDTGAPMALARALLAMFTTPPVDPAVNFVVWSPNYITDASYRVALVDLRSGGEGFKLDLRLQRWGWTPQPLELEMRIIEEV